MQIFGNHNLQNISAAYQVCKRIGISDQQFYTAISSFKGAAKRMQLIKKDDQAAIYRDFAHAPSKLEASVQALKGQFPDRKLIACLELHTFSSLNKEFLPQYQNTFMSADVPVVYFNPQVVEQKRLTPISEEDVKNAFDQPNLQVFTKASELENFLKEQKLNKANLLLMSSANFGGIDLESLANELI